VHTLELNIKRLDRQTMKGVTARRADSVSRHMGRVMNNIYIDVINCEKFGSIKHNCAPCGGRD
jgi:hypothetical protein